MVSSSAVFSTDRTSYRHRAGMLLDRTHYCSSFKRGGERGGGAHRPPCVLCQCLKWYYIAHWYVWYVRWPCGLILKRVTHCGHTNSRFKCTCSSPHTRPFRVNAAQLVNNYNNNNKHYLAIQYTNTAPRTRTSMTPSTHTNPQQNWSTDGTRSHSVHDAPSWWTRFATFLLNSMVLLRPASNPVNQSINMGP